MLNSVSNETGRIFGFNCEIVPLLDDIEFALDQARNQYHSTLILERLADLSPVHAIKVIAITRVDLFIPILTHIYGEAQLGGKTCIISIHRLMEGVSTVKGHGIYMYRILKEVIHELGHTFALRHCPEKTCIMHHSHTVSDVDGKSDQLCRYCNVLLGDEIKKLSRM